MDRTHDCQQICINLPGTFACTCEKGFSTDTNEIDCTDNDECALGSHNCHVNAGKDLILEDLITVGLILYDSYLKLNLNEILIEECINLPSGFQCDCLVGYEGNGIHCKDINECMTGAHNCPGNISFDRHHTSHMI